MIFGLVVDGVAAAVLGLWSLRAATFEKGVGSWFLEMAAEGWPPGTLIFQNAGRSLGSILLAVFLLAVFDAVGLRLLRFLLGRIPRAALRLGAVFAGYGAVSAFLLGAGCAGIWYDSVLLLIFAGMVVFASGIIRKSLGDWRGLVSWFWNGSGLSAKIALAFAGALWASLLLVPEIHIDCMQYHLALPEQMGVWHRIPGRGTYNGWAIPVASDLPNAFPLLFGLDSAATLLRPALILAGAAAFVRALGVSLPPAHFAVLLGLSALSPDMRFVLATAKNDAVVCGYFLVFCAFLASGGIVRRKVEDQGALLAAGLFAGSVLASKYILLPLVLVLLAAAVFGSPHLKRGKTIGFLAAGVLMPFLPWAVKSYVFYADPLYPAGLMYLPSLLGDPSTNENTRLLYEMLIRHDRPPGSVFGEIWRLTIRNSPLFLAGGLFLFRRPFAGSGFFTAAFLVGLAGIFLASRGAIDAAERYAYPVFTALGLLGGAALFSAAPAGQDGGWKRRRAILCVLSAVLAFLFLARLFAYQRILYTGMFLTEYHAGRVSAAEYRARGMYTYGATLPAVKKIAAEDRAGHRLLMAGETLSFGLPLRAWMDNLEPPFLWKAARESPTWERVAVKFRQAGIRLVVYNLPIAGWARYGYSPYLWTEGMLSRYKEFARRHFRVRWFNGYRMPFYGSDWLISVSSKPLEPLKRMLFLPGTESIYSYGGLAEANGHFREAAVRFNALRSNLGDVSWTDSLLGNALTGGREYRSAYPLIKRSIEEGLLDDTNLLDWAVCAGKTGRLSEMMEALARADAFHPISPLRIREALEKAGLLEAARRAGYVPRYKWRPWWPQ